MPLRVEEGEIADGSCRQSEWGVGSMGGLGVQTPVSDARKTGIVATMTIFGAGFSLGWAALTYVVTTEIIPLRLRDNGQRVASLINILMK